MIIHHDPRDGVALAAFKSDRWPASRRNSGRLQIGTPGRLRRNTQAKTPTSATMHKASQEKGLGMLMRGSRFRALERAPTPPDGDLGNWTVVSCCPFLRAGLSYSAGRATASPMK